MSTASALVQLIRELPIVLMPLLERAVRALLSGNAVELTQTERDRLSLYTLEQFDLALFDASARARDARMLQLGVTLQSIAAIVRDGHASLETAAQLERLAHYCLSDL